jgi:hypothetical protein
MIRRKYALLAILVFAPAGCFLLLFWRSLFALMIGNCSYGPGVHDFSAALGGGYALYHTSAYHVVIRGPTGFEIPPSVEELAYDSSFILAKQQHLRPRFEGDDGVDPVAGEFSYWILDLTRSKYYGPLSEEQFASKRAELKVDPSLKLRRESSYDPRGDGRRS